MSSESDRAGFDPKLPWHVQVRRNGYWMTVETFRTAGETINYVVELPDPKAVNVLHVPTQMDGSGESFINRFSVRLGMGAVLQAMNNPDYDPAAEFWE